MTPASQIAQTYQAVLDLARPLADTTRFWFGVALMGEVLAAALIPVDGSLNTPAQSMLVFLGNVVNAYALLIGWYTAHRYLITGTQPESVVPRGLIRDRKAFEFVMAQVRNILLLTAISLVFLGPLTVYCAFTYSDLPPEEILQIQRTITLVALPLFVIFFARLLLVAPLAARGELQAVSRSWRATRGHFIRLNLLQLGCLAPAVLTVLIGKWLQTGGNMALLIVGAVILTAGAFFSLTLYAQLAEDEYKKLV